MRRGRAGHAARAGSRRQRVGWPARFGGRRRPPVWAPFPIRVAYLLRTAGGSTVRRHVGNGTHRFTVTPAAPVAPAWRWDSKALAYVDGDRRRRGARRDRRADGRSARRAASARRGRRVRAVGRHARDRRPQGHLRSVDTGGHTAPRCARRSPAGCPRSGGWARTSSSPGPAATLSRIVIRRVGTGPTPTRRHDRGPRRLARRPPHRGRLGVAGGRLRGDRGAAPIQARRPTRSAACGRVRTAPSPAPAGAVARPGRTDRNLKRAGNGADDDVVP